MVVKQDWKLWTVGVLAIALCLRFYNLDHKYYWFDEAYTSLRASGYTEAELVQQVSQNPQSVAEFLGQYQAPNLQKNAWDTIQSLAQEEPQHPPLYFLLVRFWTQIWGSSIAATRSLSALSSLLVLPCLYGFCWELFHPFGLFHAPSDRRKARLSIGGMAVLLAAVSPFQVLYAQEARQYSLWMGLILVANGLLLRSLRLNTRRNWAAYALSLSLGLYTFSGMLMTIATHGIYVLMQRGRSPRSQIFQAYTTATFIGLLSFLPWMILMVKGLGQINKTFVRTERFSVPTLVGKWVLNLTRLFIDPWDYERGWKYSTLHPLVHPLQIIISLLILVLVLCSFRHLFRHAPVSVSSFIAIQCGLLTLPLMLLNLVAGGFQSTVLRYLMPAVLMVGVAIAFFLIHARPQWIFPLVTTFLITGGLLSCILSSQAHFWWIKSRSDANYQAAPLINQSPRPLLISDAPTGRILAFSHLLQPEVQLLLQPECFSCQEVRSPSPPLPPIPPNFSDTFLYNPSPQLMKQLTQRGFSLQVIWADPIHAEQKVLKLQQKDD
jgi:uncharacterized membrane protein